jgi:hypothetical protein
VLHRIKRLLAAILSPMRIESAALTGTPTKIAATAAAGLTVERRSHGRLRESACVLLGNRWAPSRHENHHPLGPRRPHDEPSLRLHDLPIDKEDSQ